MYPRLVVDIKRLRENTIKTKKLLDSKGISMMLTTKCFCADNNILKAIEDIDFDYLADSRIDNIKSYSWSKKKKVLIRIPMLSELEDVVDYADISLVSEMKTIKMLGELAKAKSTTQSIILMVELGDLREGVLKEDVLDYVSEIIKLNNIRLVGLGVNLTCYGSVIPTRDKLEVLVKLKKQVKEKFNYDIDIISGGNSSSMYLIEIDEMPTEVNNLRLGEVVLFGRETSYGNRFMDLNEDIFTLEAEIIEARIKDTLPNGKQGLNAFGEKIEYIDLGKRKRAILAIGKQDVNHDDIEPVDDRVSIFGSSSDHLIVDITDTDYKLGDIIKFNLTYSSVLKLYTSKYVKKEYIYE